MYRIIVVGLGSGDPDHLPMGVYRLLSRGDHPVLLRTEKHPVVDFLRNQGIQPESYDGMYEKEKDFEQVYERIVADLLEKASRYGTVVYGVPGHPLVAERTVRLLLEKEREQDIQVEIRGGESFLDPLFTTLQIDPIEGFVLLDAMTLKREDLRPGQHTIIAQIYDSLTASEVKLTLMELYPDDYPVKRVTAAGVKGMEKVEEMPLYQLDRLEGVENLMTVYVPPAKQETVWNREFSRLKDVFARLRGPEGCPWDRKQTHQSLRKYLIEETYETVEAIDEGDPDRLCDELGDVLLQIMLHAQIAEEEGYFTVYDVIENLNQKMIRRHPHVFGDLSVQDSQEVTANWQEIKNQEKREKGEAPEEASVLSGVPRDLPAVLTAWKMQKKAAGVGFDWDNITDVMAKVEEEWEELKMAEPDQRKKELGDVLFALVNLARFYDIDPEEALALTNLKFKQRFQYIEQKLKEANRDFSHTNLHEMEKWWQESKKTYP
ncbi:MAG: nucleoside triphosphate pyrophosphohydrolase [Bacillaceae bacterium]|nr:nucleoside triphosphate pyrophosphohydrolase [Bacillaceae bacterium]